ncbi:GroES-like protein [Dothidotthia symphoricarpi CBS 119687]|uniref:GroES-like protein n=1 Tax=Dothidotthia symphoricarpi CBS 119687 TaxID=1392245 RepID=A0A6A5ZY98_9PLEO|nr:GroES-like protein [Dothidotthia symphoricarpi CBS 119687]KAF2124266.1 GroES-like protein [Dothidotthia symphoricarpi CBS 119687]
MRGVVGLGQAYNVSVIDVPIPTILNATDVIVRMNMSAICGSDMHFYHTESGSPESPWYYGHEGIGYVTEIGDAVQFLSVGDYVVIPDNVDSGHYTPGPNIFDPSLTFGAGPEGLDGMQTDYTRVPFGDRSLIPVPVNASTDESTLIDYLFVSDIFATAWSGVTFSGFVEGDTVAVFGAGPVGLLAAYSAILRGASRVYIVDQVQSRLDLGASIGAIPINFRDSDPVEQILAREPGGVRRTVEAVGFEAVNATGQTDSSITLRNMVNVTAAKGGMGVLGVFPEGINNFDIGLAYQKQVNVHGGVVIPLEVASEILPLIISGRAKPSFIVSSIIGIEEVPEYFARFSRHEETKVVIRL